MLALIQETLWSGWNGECQPSENTSLHESTGNGSRELFSNGGFDRSWVCDQMTTIYMTVTVRERACTITVLAMLVAVRTNESRGKGWVSVRTEQEEKPAKTQKDVHTFPLWSSSSGCWWSCVSVSQTRPSVFPVPKQWTQIQTFTFICLAASIRYVHLHVFIYLLTCLLWPWCLLMTTWNVSNRSLMALPMPLGMTQIKPHLIFTNLGFFLLNQAGRSSDHHLHFFHLLLQTPLHFSPHMFSFSFSFFAFHFELISKPSV